MNSPFPQRRLYKRLLSLTATTLVATSLTLPITTIAQTNTTVQILKRNASSFAIDGNRGAEEAQDVYLWSENENNINQQWIEIDRGNGYFSYQKSQTRFCLDGGNGGANSQNVYLWACATNNHNQHWLKVSVGQGNYRLEKRNAPGFSIDGNNGGENAQSIYLWESNNNNRNQHWSFNVVEEKENPTVNNTVLPATIEAEAFDSQQGVEVETTRDTGGGQQIGFIESGDYTEYQVFAPNSGTYRLNVRASSRFDGGTINVQSNGSNVGSVSVPGTGNWNSFVTVSSTIELEAGNQTIRLAFDGGRGYLFNLNSFDITEADDSETPTRDWNVSNLFELRDAIKRNNQDIVMRPGNYSITELPNDSNRYFRVSGDNNTIDLTGVHLEFPVEVATPEAHFYFSGRGNTLIGGTIENTYRSGITEITDYVGYNVDRDFLSNGGKPHLVIAGNDTTIIDTKMIVRGSFPYGYGSYFGIGGRNSFGLDKRGGIQVNSTNTILDGIELEMNAFSHGIYIGPGEGAVTDNTIIRNATVRGNVRLTNDILSDSGRDSLVVRNDYRDSDGNRIPSNDAESLSEDGIRSYGGAGSVFVENSVVSGMRSGIRLWLGTETRVTNTTVLDNRIANVSMNRDGVVKDVKANFTYGPALLIDGSEQNQDVDMTLLPSPNAVGSHNIADIKRESNIVFRRNPGPVDSENRVIMVTADNAKITNHTEYTIVLASGTRGNEIIGYCLTAVA